ncbi:1-deoxy-D-xylulose-5-phosphate synthase [Sinanaerobacter chloroacetimidivorans]|uniref:1-deoxy-D-xylulose-5-phosphate synthase n=1 Tax=Sinanaerobacter chloroacetimidivorans TaxID=2818044 RepID=A0A8J8B098_9FIRM|nr:1-deoxy-D-xylulose-5-phosphate synthase [Sinanaerobacter chloroacetimidivorans]MBR0596617.1 1-deoxy-D-xylulose-5-phosphate synthase [Sinanaerobacter chloroacetimidivorans]
MKKLLNDYHFPEDLKSMSERELELLTYEIRDFLIEKVSKTGGHLASNLGVVELSIALHKVFNSPKDKIIWDVGHQSYVHKILTGRAACFDGLRCLNGISGFPKRDESVHDMFDTGHSSTSISAAMGYATARDLSGDDYSVISVIGDGALTGGMAYEALNNAGASKSKMIVILNDNEMSISKNIGGMSHHLAKLRASQTYLDFKKQLKRALKGIPGVGEGLYNGFEHIRDSVKYAIVQGAIFEELGFKYFGPVDGHNIHDLLEVLSYTSLMEEPVLIHVITKKGKGYRNAETNPGKFHGISAFDPTTGNVLSSSDNLSYSTIFGNKMIQLAHDNPKVVAVSAAMIEATGLGKFAQKFPKRIFDAGIAEAHAVTFAAGLAANGYQPVVAIYSTFLQRAYDQIVIDVCMQNLPVVFTIDRAGNVGSDGETHHGIFDLSYLNHIPNLTILAPKDGKELAAMLEYALSLKSPCAIRYPKGEAFDYPSETGHPIDGTCESLFTGEDVEIFAVGKMVSIGLEASKKLKSRGIDSGLTNVRFIKPVDRNGIIASAKRTGCLITLEDNVLDGGFGRTVSAILQEEGFTDVKLLSLGWPDKFIEQGSTEELFELYGLDSESIAERVCDFLEGKA